MYKYGEKFEHRFSGFTSEEDAGAWLEDTLVDFFHNKDQSEWTTMTSIGRNYYGSWYAEYTAEYTPSEG